MTELPRTEPSQTEILSATIEVPARDVIVRLSLQAGEVLALVGPNGAGKSTVLQALSGVLPSADDSRIWLDGADASALPAHRRRITMLSQDPTLFPHLTLSANVAFPLRAAGVPRGEARTRAAELLAEVDCADLGQRKPHQVSGGQAQRAAIARALAASPALLLLDEPLVALDAEQAPQLRHLLRRVLRERNQAAIIITHDLVDAVALTDSVAVLQQGRVIERGSTRIVLGSPRTPFAASLAGMNLFTGVVTGGLLACPPVDGGADTVQIAGTGQDDDVPGEGEPAVALFAPATVSVHIHEPDGSPRNSFPATISSVESHDSGVRVRARCAAGAVAADITAAALAELGLEPGDRVWFSMKAQTVQLIPSV